MERASVRTEATGAVTTIILDRPDRRNAIDRPTGKALAAAFRAFERDADARVAVLWGANGTFCAGADLKAVAAGPTRRRIHYGDGPMGPTRMRLSKPVIAAVAGYAVAGGFELALWGDLRVVEEDAVMGVFNRRWGIPLIDGGTVRLPALVGLGRALDIILTGRPVAWPTASWPAAARAPRPRPSPPPSRPSHPTASAATDARPTNPLARASRPHSDANTFSAPPHSTPAKASPAPEDSPAAPAATANSEAFRARA